MKTSESRMALFRGLNQIFVNARFCN